MAPLFWERAISQDVPGISQLRFYFVDLIVQVPADTFFSSLRNKPIMAAKNEQKMSIFWSGDRLTRLL